MIPKFRAWIKEEKCFADYIETIRYYAKEVDLCWGGICESDCFDFEGVIFTQSTGLKDKNGKEIFEFDVVSLPPFEGVRPWTGVVKRMKGAWVVDTGKASVPLWSEIEETEILGNMFENPELLEAIE